MPWSSALTGWTKLGLEAPTTLDEFMEVAKAFTFNDPDGNGKDDTYGYCAFIDGSGLAAMGLGSALRLDLRRLWRCRCLESYQC